MEYKEIKADVGYRKEYKDGSVEFFCGHSDAGVCYIDMKAYESGKGVCYIREAMFDETESLLYTQNELEEGIEDVCDKMQFIETCTTFVEDYKLAYRAYFGDEETEQEFIKYIADGLISVADWAGIDVYLADWDLRVEYKEFIDNK